VVDIVSYSSLGTNIVAVQFPLHFQWEFSLAEEVRGSLREILSSMNLEGCVAYRLDLEGDFDRFWWILSFQPISLLSDWNWSKDDFSF
jgi:hypothetical protein